MKFTVDGSVVWVILNNDKIYAGDTLSVVTGDGITVDQMASFAQEGNVLTLTNNSSSVVTLGYIEGAWLVSDGSAGTYEGSLGTIISTGYGSLTVDETQIEYSVLSNGNLRFIVNNRMVIVAISGNSYSLSQDGYAGTYTLPDDAGTIVLDGLGGAGEGATYVVRGAQITIYTADGSTNYGLDVENKVLLGKSIFAGLKFEDSTYIYVQFADDSEITGKFSIGAGGAWYVNFNNGVLIGNTLTVTCTQQVGNVCTKADLALAQVCHRE